MHDSMFRDLDEKEIAEFRQWARDNHKVGDYIPEIWHPVIRDECKLIDISVLDDANESGRPHEDTDLQSTQ